MTEPANVTTESGAVADGDEAVATADTAAPSGHGDPSAPDAATDGDADLVAEH